MHNRINNVFFFATQMFAKKGFNVFENTLATTVNEFVTKELVKVTML